MRSPFINREREREREKEREVDRKRERERERKFLWKIEGNVILDGKRARRDEKPFNDAG